MKKLLFVIIIFLCNSLKAQQDILQESVDYILQGNREELVNIEDLLEQLRTFLKKPININKANTEELTALPILSHQQANAIIEYRTENGNIISIYELKHLNFSPRLLELLKHYCKTEEQNQNINSNSILIFRMQQKFKPKEVYIGNPLKIYTRYKYSASNFQIGFTAEKDQGEAFCRQNAPQGFDFYSGYIQYQKKQNTLAIGDFSINNGQGLVLSNAFRSIYNNSPLYTNLYQNQIKPFTSSNENSFFRGICFQKKIKRLTIQPFVSFKQIDATIVNDTIKSFPNTGYHRTLNELDKKDKSTELALGNTFSYTLGNLTLGLNQFIFKYNYPYFPDSNYYKKNNAINNWQSINSTDVNYRCKNINLFGELSLNNNRSISYIAGLTASLNKIISSSIRFRNFGNNNFAPYAYTYSQNTQPTNEKGIDFSLLLNLSKDEQLSLNFDVFKNPNFKYGIKRPSYGKEFNLLFQKALSENSFLYFKYQYQEHALLFDHNILKKQSKSHQFRSQFSWKFTHTSTLSFRNEIRWIDGKSGWLSYLNIKYKIKNSPFDFYCRYTIFNIQDYSARIYAYENDVIYSSSTPAHSNIGKQIFGMLKFQYNRHLNFWFKFSAEELKIQLVYEN